MCVSLLARYKTRHMRDIYKRFKDDVAGASSCSEEDFRQSPVFASSVHPNLEWTIVKSTSKYYKDTDSHSYLNFSSCRPSINEQSILRVSETMFLAVFLDDNLTWKPHISLLASKLSKSIGIIYKSRFFSLNSISPYLVQFNDTSILILLQSSLGWQL